MVINLFATQWPELLQFDGFLQEFITPIVKISKGSKKKPKMMRFYTIPEFEKWLKENNNGAGWKVKYYKGLGTSDRQEGIEYFADLERHQLDFKYTGKESDDAITLAFDKRKGASDKRKVWLETLVQGAYLDQTKGMLTYEEFIHQELILFSYYSVQRAIANIVDGQKPSLRKILFTCLDKNLTEELKVVALQGRVMDSAAYHHGPMSLEKGIVGMCQNYVGSNNINLLMPAGQFGSTRNTHFFNHNCTLSYIY